MFTTVIFYLIGAYLLFNCCYILFFAIAGHRKNNRKISDPKTFRNICILIPAYKEDTVILDTAKAAMKQDYKGLFEVFVIADGLKPETILALKDNGVNVIQVYFEKSTKGKALQSALALLPENVFYISVVLDADNLMDKNFLTKIDSAFEEGYQVVQGHRTAKNIDTPFALLDACNEEINNQIFRKGHHAVGMSAALIGSGMAFQFTYLKKLLVGIGEVAGEDKELDFRIVKDNIHIHYLHDALVYDEKVTSAQVFTGQRSRWIGAQIDCCRKYFFQGFRELFQKGNIAFFDKVLQTLLLPRILLMGTLSLLFILSFLNSYSLPSVFWAALLLIAGGALLISLPARFYHIGLIKAVVCLPLAFFSMCHALFNIRKAKRSFIHTPHSQTSGHVSLNTNP